MNAVPGFERLQRGLGRAWCLSGPWQGELPVELVEVYDGVALDAQHRCYHAVFALPPGVQLPQVSCSLQADDGDQWPMLLLTPARPAADGRQRMQATFHCSIPQPPLPSGPAAESCAPAHHPQYEPGRSP